MIRVLFQGDSITDAGREDRAAGTSMGVSYALMVAGELGNREPGKYQFVNFGISGNKITDLISRFNRDFVGQKPDVVSILIGVNDVWHEVDIHNGVDAPRFEKLYRGLLEDLREAMPALKIMIMEPFVLDGSATHEFYESYFKPEVAARAAIAKKLAAEFDLPFIPLQCRFDEALERYPEPSYWLKDGVHPTYSGHRVIADAWLECFEKLDLN